jgi:hypothetical protein
VIATLRGPQWASERQGAVKYVPSGKGSRVSQWRSPCSALTRNAVTPVTLKKTFLWRPTRRISRVCHLTPSSTEFHTQGVRGVRRGAGAPVRAGNPARVRRFGAAPSVPDEPDRDPVGHRARASPAAPRRWETAMGHLDAVATWSKERSTPRPSPLPPHASCTAGREGTPQKRQQTRTSVPPCRPGRDRAPKSRVLPHLFTGEGGGVSLSRRGQKECFHPLTAGERAEETHVGCIELEGSSVGVEQRHAGRGV